MTREPEERARDLLDHADKFDGFAFVASVDGRDVEVVLDAPTGGTGLRKQLTLIGVYLDAMAATLGDDVEPEDVANDALSMLDDRTYAAVTRDGGADE